MEMDNPGRIQAASKAQFAPKLNGGEARRAARACGKLCSRHISGSVD
jgi:hypothetical protein